jgi:hypothetical protein
MSLTFNPNFEFISINNSSTANLAASATFTGTADDIKDADVVHVVFFATQNCTLALDQSPDGTNWDITDSFSYSANVSFSTSVTAVGQYYRIRVTNIGASSTTSLRLQSQYSSGIAATPRSLGQKVSTQSLPVVVSSDQSAIPSSQSGSWTTGRTWTLSAGSDAIAAAQSGVWTVSATQGTSPWVVSGTVNSSTKGDLMSSYQPDPSNVVDVVDGAKFEFDAANRLEVHFAGSDEGGFRDDFAGTILDTNWTSSATGTGASISVASGRVSLVSGTANGATTLINRAGDYLPYTLQFYGKITQRIANQTSTFGFADNAVSPTKQALVVFDGTNNTTVKFRTGWGGGATEIQETVVTIPAGGNTSADQTYNISLSSNQATLAINGLVVARHTLHIPGPYDIMDIHARTINSAVVTTSTLSFDYVVLNNWDRFQVDSDFLGEPLLVQTYVDSNTSYSSVGRTELSQQAVQGTAFTLVNNSLLAQSTETRLLYLTNSGSNSKTLYLANILLAVDVSSANWCNFQLYYNPTVTANGTAATISNLKAGASTVSVMNAYTGPTVTANGTRVYFFPIGNSNQAGAFSPYNANPYIIIPPGNSLLITGTAKANNTPVVMDLNWFEAT